MRRVVLFALTVTVASYVASSSVALADGGPKWAPKGPVIRDHRDHRDTSHRPGGVVVTTTPRHPVVIRDHRPRPAPVVVRPRPRPTVRDHRDPPTVVVRDHRSPGPIVRDHRSPGPVVRDHRQ